VSNRGPGRGRKGYGRASLPCRKVKRGEKGERSLPFTIPPAYSEEKEEKKKNSLLFKLLSPPDQRKRRREGRNARSKPGTPEFRSSAQRGKEKKRKQEGIFLFTAPSSARGRERGKRSTRSPNLQPALLGMQKKRRFLLPGGKRRYNFFWRKELSQGLSPSPRREGRGKGGGPRCALVVSSRKRKENTRAWAHFHPGREKRRGTPDKKKREEKESLFLQKKKEEEPSLLYSEEKT